jgi:anti-sigma B factor antagonist
MTTTLSSVKVATVEPCGYVSVANAQELQQQLSHVVNSEEHSILVVDMKQVEFLDSAGLMVLVNGFRMAQELGRRLIICSIAPSVRIIFELTQLDKVFEIFDTRASVEAALAVY